VLIWFEYKDDPKLMYIPLPSIIQVLLYLAIIKLVFFFINVLMMDARWYERKWITKYPIMVEVFLDYGIVSYLLCDAFELAVVYYYSSRFMAPENTVSLVSFWIPTFQFIMSFIPGVYHIYVLIRNWRAKKQERKRQQKTQNMEDSISNTSLRNQQVFRFHPFFA